MNILLIGGSGTVTDAIIKKLNKEGHRIYVLTGSELNIHKYNHVFEKYCFSYESNSIKEIFESITPDVTLYMGAHDSNFKWLNPREESIRYSSSLTNVLMGYSLVKSGKFIYLSDQSVYERSYPNPVSEDEPTCARSFKSMVIQQGEELCKNYTRIEGLDIRVVRLDHLCYEPAKLSEVNDPCSKMCLKAIEKGVIEANGNHKFSLLYISDAVEFLYKIITGSCEQFLYHLSSSKETDELKMATLIKKTLKKGVEVVDNTVGNEYSLILSNQRYKDEFGGKIFNRHADVIPQIASYMKSHKQKYKNNEPKGTGLLNLIFKNAKGVFATLFPFVENMICFIPFFMLNNRAVGSAFFNKLDFYLLYVLLFAIVHGQQQATFSAMLATAGYCFRQMYTRSGFEVMLDYNTYIWVAQLFILGLAVGYLKDRLNIVKREDKDEINYLSGQIEDIQDINSSNVRIKNVLEEQIINHNQSVGTIYEITSELEQYAPEEVLFYAAEVVSRILGNSDVAIYRVDNDKYARLFSATSQKARSMGNSLLYNDLEEVYDEISAQKVYVNKTLKKKYPLLANAIFENDNMEILIFVWGIPLERLNLGLANMLKVVSYLIQNAVLRANRYQEALEKERYREGTQILESRAFSNLVKAYLKAQDRNLTQCSLLEIKGNREEITKTEAIEKLLRGTDYIGELADGKLYILLSNTDYTGSQKVIERLNGIGYEAIYREEVDI